VRQPRRGAQLKSIDEAAIRRATRERVELVRDGDFLAVVADDETVAMQAVDVVRRNCVWDGGVAIPVDAGEPAFLMAQPSKDRVIERRPTRAHSSPTRRLRRPAHSRSSPTGA
jgi:hypothetical protein